MTFVRLLDQLVDLHGGFFPQAGGKLEIIPVQGQGGHIAPLSAPADCLIHAAITFRVADIVVLGYQNHSGSLVVEHVTRHRPACRAATTSVQRGASRGE
jgi:hypothetical protein